MEESWEINSVSHFKSFFKLHIVSTEHFSNEYELINNLSYNFQYLQFLTNVLKSEELHEVIRRLNIKTYLIVSTSIIESILDYYLIYKGEYKMCEWKDIEESKISSNIFLVSNKPLKNITITQRKTEPFFVKMKFDDVLKKIKDKKLLGDNSDLYKSLNNIKKLRNKVHLNNIEGDRDHDWNNFQKTEYYECSKCLREILKSNIFNVSIDELKDKFVFLTYRIK
jgi:hypothetical protein